MVAPLTTGWRPVVQRAALLLLLLRMVAVAYQPELYEGDTCSLNDGQGSVGVCRAAESCSWLRQTRKLPDNLVTCSFNRSMAIVCCKEQVIPSISKRISEIECERLPNSSSLLDHIFNGELAQLGEFPHMAALGYNGTGNGTADGAAAGGSQSLFRCAASVIAPQFLLTAAHCLNEPPQFARLGVVDLFTRSQVDTPVDIAIEESYVHPDYRPFVYRNDLAVLRLAEPITDRFIDPACLYTSSAGYPPPDLVLSVQGWGTTLPGDTEPSTWLRKANVTSIERTTCATMLPQNRRSAGGIQPGQICALGRNRRNETTADTCLGDSGGPLQVTFGGKHYIVGVTSYGFTCGSRRPGIYTDVAHYLDWIESIVWPDPEASTVPDT